MAGVAWLVVLVVASAAVLDHVECAKYRITPSSTSVLQGQTVILQCAFYDLTAKDIVTWDGPPNYESIAFPSPGPQSSKGQNFPLKPVIHHESVGRAVVDLILPTLTKWDNGVNFTCTADQGYPQLTHPKSSSAILSVHYPPTVIVPQTSVHVREGSPANLSCMVDSNPPATVTWRKLGHGLVMKGKKGGQTMSLPKASRYDSGVYECTADNGVLPHGMGTATLDVQYAPWIDPTMDDEITLMHDQEGFKLRCLADGNPKPHIRWRRKDTSLYWENPLRFHRVRYDVEGTYQCVATSDGFQEVTKDTFINIVGRPQLLGEESVSATAVAAGGTARFACDIMADPMPDRIIWLWRDRDGIEKELTVASGEFIAISKKRDTDTKSSSSSLTIKDVSYNNEGTYICRASNMFGSVQRNFQLQLTESDHLPAVIIATTAGIVLVATIVIIGIAVAKKKGLICITRPPEPLGVSAPRPMPPIPKYGRKRGHGTNDSGVEDLELQEVDGTMKPRPPPRVDKEWKAVGLTYTAHAAKYRVMPKSTAVLSGGTITMKCAYDELTPADTVVWLGPPNFKKLLATGKAVNPRFQRYAITGDHSKGEFNLAIRDARRRDEGEYKCSTFGVDEAEGQATLTVVDPPEVFVPRPSIFVKEGDLANLTCLVDGNPASTVTWRKLDHHHSLAGTERGNHLILHKVSRYDAGVYQCTADNGIPPVDVGTVTLEVRYPPWIDPSMKQTITVQYDNDGFSLDCLAEGNPKPHIRWRRKDTSLYWENPLRFNRVDYGVEGTYECVATNAGFPEVSKETKIDVIGLPHLLGQDLAEVLTVQSGGTARLGCRIVADPLPGRITWVWRNKHGIENTLHDGLNGITINDKITEQEMSSALTVKHVDVGRAGTYICQASNIFGPVKRNIQLEVKESKTSLFIIIIATTASALALMATMAFGCVLKKRRVTRKQRKPTAVHGVSASRPMPPVPKYIHATNTIDSGVEDLELHELDRALKPHPSSRGRDDKEWKSVGLAYSGLVHSTSLPPYSTVERQLPDGEDNIRHLTTFREDGPTVPATPSQ
ncbi:PREDICTED: hemicentin-1-like [Branchiostoma belcheri]|uniref:Hemicentin-1-like n=1 Tax=Branchiostoma belcheri TaxID=7741 RepID=A0A6P4Y417_BRABE|nr:PREDICTED: hemicentin-1-like [Branchiostoma belcheri]